MLADPIERPECPAIEIIRGDHVSVLAEAFEHSGDRRRSGSKGKSDAAVFEIGETALQGLPCGIAGPGVCVAFVDPGAFLRVGRGSVDRCRDRAGGRIGLAAAMHRTGRKSVSVVPSHCFVTSGLWTGHQAAGRSRQFGGGGSGWERISVARPTAICSCSSRPLAADCESVLLPLVPRAGERAGPELVKQQPAEKASQ
jgi:hypothetical protein